MKNALLVLTFVCVQLGAMDKKSMERAAQETQGWRAYNWRQYHQEADHRLEAAYDTIASWKSRRRERVNRTSAELKKLYELEGLADAISPQVIDDWFGPRFVQDCVRLNVEGQIGEIVAMGVAVHAQEDAAEFIEELLQEHEGNLLSALVALVAQTERHGSCEVSSDPDYHYTSHLSSSSSSEGEDLTSE